MDWNQVSIDLNKKLDPSAIKPAPKGKFGEYVDAYHVISEANRIFGNGGWSYEITRIVETHRAVLMLKGTSGSYEQFRCSYMCTVKVSVGETFREGSAVGMGSGKPDNVGDVIESAVKEAETDALKRALRSYGNTFGLALYDKARVNVGPDEPDVPAFNPSAAADRIIAKFQKQNTAEDLAAVWEEEKVTRGDIFEASKDQYARVKMAAADVGKRIKGSDAPLRAPGSITDDEIPYEGPTP